VSTDETESIESFRERARHWIRENLAAVGPQAIVLPVGQSDEEELELVAKDRVVQRKLHDGGFAGLCFPREFGGQGLTPEHQQTFNEEMKGYEFPVRLQSPTFAPCAAVLNDFGTPEQKRKHLPAIFKGEEIWMQFLSEPSGGSDLAGVLTTAVRDGDEWVLNGSKIWTSGAWWSDWGICLARTNWDVPKHSGLTVFILPIKRKGIEVRRIEMLNGSKEFCQEFFSDVRVPDTDRIGDVDDGWTVASRWMFHERMLYNSPYVTIPMGTTRGRGDDSSLVNIARAAGRLDDRAARDLVGEAAMLDMVGASLAGRISRGIASKKMSDQISGVARLFSAMVTSRRTTIMFDLAGSGGAAWSDDEHDFAERGNDFLMRQVYSIAGGTTEMARNVISERVLGMPRERSLDRDTAFRDVPRGRRAD
jgi:alkylation response protein AidB-like acyl-CoA dehydrogenase